MTWITLVFLMDVVLIIVYKVFGTMMSIPNDDSRLMKSGWLIITIYLLSFTPTRSLFDDTKRSKTKPFLNTLYLDGINLLRIIRVFHFFYLKSKRIARFNRVQLIVELIFVLYFLSMVCAFFSNQKKR